MTTPDPITPEEGTVAEWIEQHTPLELTPWQKRVLQLTWAELEAKGA